MEYVSIERWQWVKRTLVESFINWWKWCTNTEQDVNFFSYLLAKVGANFPVHDNTKIIITVNSTKRPDYTPIQLQFSWKCWKFQFFLIEMGRVYQWITAKSTCYHRRRRQNFDTRLMAALLICLQRLNIDAAAVHMKFSCEIAAEYVILRVCRFNIAFKSNMED